MEPAEDGRVQLLASNIFRPASRPAIVSTAPGPKESAQLASWGHGKTYAAWTDHRAAATSPDLYATRLRHPFALVYVFLTSQNPEDPTNWRSVQWKPEEFRLRVQQFDHELTRDIVVTGTLSSQMKLLDVQTSHASSVTWTTVEAPAIHDAHPAGTSHFL
jgi:hypothetical protein